MYAAQQNCTFRNCRKVSRARRPSCSPQASRLPKAPAAGRNDDYAFPQFSSVPEQTFSSQQKSIFAFYASSCNHLLGGGVIQDFHPIAYRYPNYRVAQEFNNKTQSLVPIFPCYIIIPLHTTFLSLFPAYHHLKHKPVLPLNTQDSGLYIFSTPP